MKTKATKRAQRSAANKMLLYETAKKLFILNGYEATTVNDICKASGISVGSFYHYYKSKDGILLAICQHIADFDIGLTNNLPEKVLEPQKYLREYFSEYGRLWEGIGVDLATQIYRVFDKAFLNDDMTFKPLKCYRDLETFISAAQDADTFSKILPAHEAMHILFTFTRGILYEWCLRKGLYSLREVSDANVAVLCRLFEP